MVYPKPGIIRLDPREKYGFEPEKAGDDFILPYKPGIPVDKMKLIAKMREQRAKGTPAVPTVPKKTTPEPKPRERLIKPIGIDIPKPKPTPKPTPAKPDTTGQVTGVNLIDFNMPKPNPKTPQKVTHGEKTVHFGGHKLIIPKKKPEAPTVENTTVQPDTGELIKFLKLAGWLILAVIIIGLFIGGRRK